VRFRHTCPPEPLSPQGVCSFERLFLCLMPEGLSVPVHAFHHPRFSFCQVRQSNTSSTARIPTSIILSSGSFVVMFWTHIPGLLSRFTRQLSLFPASRMIS